MTQILGHNFIGGQRSAEGSVIVKSVDASTGETLVHDFHQATLGEVDRAARAAASAYPAFRALSAERRAEFQRLADMMGVEYDSTEADKVTRETLGADVAAEVAKKPAPPKRSTLAERAARGPTSATAPAPPAAPDR